MCVFFYKNAITWWPCIGVILLYTSFMKTNIWFHNTIVFLGTYYHMIWYYICDLIHLTCKFDEAKEKCVNKCDLLLNLSRAEFVGCVPRSLVISVWSLLWITESRSDSDCIWHRAFCPHLHVHKFKEFQVEIKILHQHFPFSNQINETFRCKHIQYSKL